MDAPSMRVATLDRGTRLLGHPMALDRLFKRLHAGHAITIGVLGAALARMVAVLINPESVAWATVAITAIRSASLCAFCAT